MKFLKLTLIYFSFLPTMAAAEIWSYQIKGKEVTACSKRKEATIDEVWESLEQATGITFDIARDILVIPSYVLQNKAHRSEYQFYPSMHACEFEREGLAAYLANDQKKLTQLKESLTAEKRLIAMTPADLPQDQRQDWVDFFAGCTSGVMKQQTSLKGVLQRVVDHCDCTARNYLNIEDKNISGLLLTEKITNIATACQRELH